MPFNETYMDGGNWALNLHEDTPRWVLDDIDVRNHLWATIVITPQHIDPADISSADLMALARYSGVYLGQGAGRTNLFGEGLAWWLGDQGDGGDLHASVDIRYNDEFLVDMLNALVFNGPNGLTLNYTGTIAEKFEIDIEGGDTKREVLDTILGQCSSEVVWQITPRGVVNVGTPAGLFPTVTTSTVVLAEQGGRDGNVIGLPASFDMSALNGEEVRNDVWVDWDDGYNSGRASLSTPSGWRDFVGASPEVRFLMDWRPKRAKPPTEKWRKVAAWQVQSETKADRLAARELNERSEVRSEIVVGLDIYDPWRFDCTPGHWVHAWDIDSGTRDLTNELYYQGEVIHPERAPVQQMTAPFLEGYGAYLRYWDGSAMAYYDLTPWAEPDGGVTQLRLGHRERLAPLAAARTMSKLKKKRIRQAARYAAGKLRTHALDERWSNPDNIRGWRQLTAPPPTRPNRRG